MFESIKKIYMVGIGGSGMCGIAEVLLNLGYEVSGSDIAESENVTHLKRLGAEIYIGHKKENIHEPHVLVVSSAVKPENVEVIQARKKQIPVIPRAEMLSELMRLKYAVCVAGTHGKTTTTSMVGLILSYAGLDPTVVVGGLFKNLKSNAKPGEGKFIVAEADESDGSFLKLTPTIAILTNIDNDHMNYYGSMENLKKTFVKFLNKVPFYGFGVLFGDDENIKDVLSGLNRPYTTYGLGKENIYRAENIKLSDEKSSYSLFVKGEYKGDITVRATGLHNVLNSLAAAAAALDMDIDLKVIKKALFEYQGVRRRLEKKGEGKGVVFYDDYAHHPSEIKLALKSLSDIYPSRRLVAVFQPHRYSRTKELASSFPGALSKAEKIYISGIYGAGENNSENLDSSVILGEFNEKAKVECIEDMAELKEKLFRELKPGDLCVTLGAGNIYVLADKLIGMLEE
ncbi:MAG: UDP-N-acetylmuramate--L-alanine ligase [Elusimicrobiota bacterium]